MRLLFITATRIGDAILSSGILQALIDQHPNVRVTVACGRAAAPLFQAMPNLERLIIIDKKRASWHWVDVWAQTVSKRWDMMVDLRGAPITYAIPAKKTWRLGRSKGGAFGEEHRVVRMARVLGLQENPPAPHLWTGSDDEARAEMLVPDDRPVIAIGPTANWSAKMWPVERFAALTDRLTAPEGLFPNARIVVFGHGDERAAAQPLLDMIPKAQCIDLIGSIDLVTAFACLRRASMYIGNDSGLMHLAAAADIPTLGLFGPSKESHYAPWGPKCAATRASLSYDEIFPAGFDHRTSGSLMEGLSVDHVEAAAQDLWQRVVS